VEQKLAVPADGILRRVPGEQLRHHVDPARGSHRHGEKSPGEADGDLREETLEEPEPHYHAQKCEQALRMTHGSRVGCTGSHRLLSVRGGTAPYARAAIGEGARVDLACIIRLPRRRGLLGDL